MTSTDTRNTVSKSVVVNAPIERAFEVFTAKFDSWWPRTHHIGKVEPFEAILEPRAGGRYYERGADGTECEWGEVLEFDPPTHLALSWHLNHEFGYVADPARASRVDVTFVVEGPSTTRVDVVHSQIERHGEHWEGVRDGVGGEGGWQRILDDFAAAV
jgi:uncharacterized protein YndB with AHSA1/START domain